MIQWTIADRSTNPRIDRETRESIECHRSDHVFIFRSIHVDATEAVFLNHFAD